MGRVESNVTKLDFLLLPHFCTFLLPRGKSNLHYNQRSAQNMHGLPLKWVGSNRVCVIRPTWSRGRGSSLREKKKHISGLSITQIKGNSTLVESMLNAAHWKMSTLFRLVVKSRSLFSSAEWVCSRNLLYNIRPIGTRLNCALKPLKREAISCWMFLLQLGKKEIYSNVSGCF